MSMRETVLQSLSAVGATHEAKFYADLFAQQAPETFALLVIDPRCLKNPLIEPLVGNLQILSNLELTPVLLVGALDDDRTSVKFQSQKLSRELDQSGVRAAKLNTASYGLIQEIRKVTAKGRLPVLEMTDRRGKMNLASLTAQLNPRKIMFLQPSGGPTLDQTRVKNLTLTELPEIMERETFSAGQVRFLDMVGEMEKGASEQRAYIIASPLNLLAELFTTRGSGTLIRRAATITSGKSFKAFSKPKLTKAISDAFGHSLSPEFFNRDLYAGFVETDYRGGALFTQLAGLPYLSKFWVGQAARGEGIGRDIWDAACADIPAFFWRSRLGNPFNDWYMRQCDGMQRSGPWRVFWLGLDAPEIPAAVLAAANAPDDFDRTSSL